MMFKRSKLAASISVCLVTLTTPYMASEALAQESAVEEVLVLGIRGAAKKSIDQKWEANSVIESITAEDIGKLPDATIADSLQRVTGVQIKRTAGEGSNVNIRGLSQVTSLINGEQFISAASITGLQANFSDIPAELLSGVDVYKSTDAGLIAGGISGTVNLKTRQPLDLDEGATGVARVEAANGTYTDQSGEKLTGFFGYNAGDMGVVVTVSASDATLANYRYGMYGDFIYQGFADDILTSTFETDADGNKVIVGQEPGQDGIDEIVFGNIDYGVTNKIANRERLGVSSSFQYRPSSSIEFLADVFYTKMDNEDLASGIVSDSAWTKTRGYVVPQAGHLINRGEGKSDEGFSLYTTDNFTLSAPRVLSKSAATATDTESLNINLQANLVFNESFEGTVRYVHGGAESRVTNNVVDAHLTNGGQHGLYRRIDGVREAANPNGYEGAVSVGVDYRGKYPTFTLPAGFGTNISEYALTSTFSEGNTIDEATLDAVRFDGTYLPSNTWIFDEASIDFGVRVAKRKVESMNYDLVAPFTRFLNDGEGGIETSYAKWKDSGIPVAGEGSDTIGRLITFEELQERGFISQVSDFGPASDGNGYFFIDPKTMVDAEGFQNAIYPGNVRAPNWFNSYKVEEDNVNLYVQANFDGQLGIFPYSGNVGVQGVGSEIAVTGYGSGLTSTLDIAGQDIKAISGAPGPLISTTVTTKKTYDYLPRLNFSIDLLDSLKARVSYAKNLTQLDARLLGAGAQLTQIAYTQPELAGVFGVRQVTENGSPLLDPWSSTNLDISLEWYFNDNGLLNLGLYQIDIDSFPTTVNRIVKGVADTDGVVRNNGIPSITQENGSGGKLKGIEIGYQQAYDFLPGLLSGLGSNINVTLADGDGGSPDFYGNENILPDNSKEQFNFILWYQKGPIQARIAYNYRSDIYNGNAGVTGDHQLASFNAPTEYVDASFNYTINDNFEVYVQGQNITEEYEESYLQWEGNRASQNIFEARYTVGVIGRF